ncbi:MAG TPA: alpha-hydroxy-acid oxidizing protein [candidate division Zixibacteria bacterium]|nr:alpha-hydroxy-acid oxidizing protein [candidate division Zixibacteria bacterium]
MSVEEDRLKAKEKMKGFCGVYRICDGDPSRLCQGQSYGRNIGMGGAGSGASFTNNVLALKKYKLKMRVVESDFVPTTETEFLGKKIAMPVMAASVTGVNSFGGEDVISEKEFCRAVILGSKKAGTIGWRGETYTYSLENTYGLDAIKEAEGWGIKICKPRDQDTIKEFFKKAQRIGAIAVGIDVDGCGSIIMAKHNKPVFNKTIDDLKELKSSTSLPFIVKGIMCLNDAKRAIEAGADAIVVSNHGGRVLDHTPGTADVLPEIVSQFKGKTSILIDGGIRTGFDVLKVLALGANGALMGRDVIRAAVGGGIDGVQRLMDLVRITLKKAMKTTNCRTIEDISSEIIY